MARARDLRRGGGVERVNGVLADVPLEAFENDGQRQWLVERGVEIISEASRHLPDDLKARNAQIPWQKVAGIGNVLRHDDESIAAPVLWKLVRADLPTLEKACRSELAAKKGSWVLHCLPRQQQTASRGSGW
jgi:uncharacterized protein with HEPN domain